MLARLDALCLRGILRCLGAGPRGPLSPSVFRVHREDIDALRFWWALSGSVGRLAERVRSRPREIQGSIGTDERTTQGEIPGALDACGTALIQARTGDGSLFVVAEPAPTWLTGPNRLLALTLRDAERAIHAASRKMSASLFAGIVTDRMRLIEDALRVSALREILMNPAGRLRLTPHERRQALKARTPLYRLAYDAAEALRGVDALDAATLAAMFSEALLPALEAWRKFEIACCVEVGAALARATGASPALDTTFSAARPCVTVGGCSVWWQRTIPSRPLHALDPGERQIADLADSLSVRDGSGRADLVIEKGGRIVSMIECKWFSEPSSWADPVWDACSQLSRYARDEVFANGGSDTELLKNSIIALSHRGGAPMIVTGGKVGCVDLADIEGGALDDWARRIAALP